MADSQNGQALHAPDTVQARQKVGQLSSTTRGDDGSFWTTCSIQVQRRLPSSMAGDVRMRVVLPRAVDGG